MNCSESYKTVFEKNKESGEMVRLYQFERQSANESGDTEWIMTAEEAYIFRSKDQDSKIIAYNFKFSQFNIEDKKLQTMLTAGKGEIDYEKKKVFLTEGVTFKDSKNRYAEGSSMEYSMETKIVNSNEKVILIDDGRRTVCLKGVEIDRENEREVCKGPNIIHRQEEGSGQEFNELFD